MPSRTLRTVNIPPISIGPKGPVPVIMGSVFLLEPYCFDKKKARAFVTEIQRQEDRTGGLLAKKRGEPVGDSATVREWSARWVPLAQGARTYLHARRPGPPRAPRLPSHRRQADGRRSPVRDRGARR